MINIEQHEIQKFSKARQSIKYLVGDGRFDYIETGSLISIKKNVNDITIPSEERTRPMDFEEFAARSFWIKTALPPCLIP